jgi:sialic acid synthase SpsE
VLRRPLKKGAMLANGDLDAKRPGSGLPPSRLDEILGRTLARDKAADEPLTLEDLT